MRAWQTSTLKPLAARGAPAARARRHSSRRNLNFLNSANAANQEGVAAWGEEYHQQRIMSLPCSKLLQAANQNSGSGCLQRGRGKFSADDTRCFRLNAQY
eukprot:scaffold20709_cov59-Phaeocystis_antarctica.AAC.2